MNLGFRSLSLALTGPWLLRDVAEHHRHPLVVDELLELDARGFGGRRAGATELSIRHSLRRAARRLGLSFKALEMACNRAF